MSGPHTAKYLLLLGTETSPRALLFSGECQYLAEMIDDDGLMIDNLKRTGCACQPPHALAQAQGDALQCYRLG